MYVWERAVQLAITETHTTNLHACIMDAEALLFTRSLELDGQGRKHDAAVERAAIEYATERLLKLKSAMPGWPAPRSIQ